MYFTYKIVNPKSYAVPTFIMLVGLPACGKTTFANQLHEKYGYEVLSSDVIRKELQETDEYFDMSMFDIPNEVVFDKLHGRIRSNLIDNKSCIMDATNLSRKKRVALLSTLRKIDCNKICLYFLTPITVCKERNLGRTGDELVPESVYDKFGRGFQLPAKYEGFNYCIPIFHTDSFDMMHDVDISALMDYNQDNKHHSLTLGNHLLKAEEYIHTYCKNAGVSKGREYALAEAALYHDIGKPYTKDFHNTYGTPTEDAHYYGHDNFGAYVYLINNLCNTIYYIDSKMPKNFVEQQKLIHNLMNFNSVYYIALIINWHMVPYLSWKDSIRSLNRDDRMMSRQYKYLFKDINLIHKADVAAH